jgi:predicted ATPase
MKIKQLRIEGFRSLKNVTWEPGDLNILIGPNGTGKSNLLRFLELMSVAAKGDLSKYIQSLGGMGAIVWDGRAPHVSFSLACSDSEAFDSYELELLYFSFTNLYLINREVLTGRERKKSETGEIIHREPNKSLYRKKILGGTREISPEKINSQETILSSASEFFDFTVGFKKYLSSFAIYQDVQVHQDARVRKPSVSRLEKRVDSDGQNLISVLHTLYTTDREFERSVDRAMQAAFGDDYEKIVFPPAADQLIQMRVRWKSLKREQPAADLSDGTLRFLFLITALAGPDPPPVMAIDEPETGLHPGMLPIIAEYAVEAATRAQLILTTHSPQLLDAFTDKNPTTTVTKWVDGETVLQNLSGDDLAYWLKEYTLGTLFKSGELESMA